MKTYNPNEITLTINGVKIEGFAVDNPIVFKPDYSQFTKTKLIGWCRNRGLKANSGELKAVLVKRLEEYGY